MLNTVERPLSALDAIFMRRSVRAYQATALERPIVRALLDAAVEAPTALHRQPWVFVVIEDPVSLEKLSDRVKAGWARTSRPIPGHDARTSADDVSQEFARRMADPEFDVFYGAPVLVVIGTRVVDPFATADCWLAAENLMLAACALGLGTCCIGAAVEALNDPGMMTELGIPAGITSVAPIVIGVPSADAPPVVRADPYIAYWK